MKINWGKKNLTQTTEANNPNATTGLVTTGQSGWYGVKAGRRKKDP